MAGQWQRETHDRAGATRTFAGRTSTIAVARRFAADAAGALGCDADVGARLALVVSELASNAVEASHDDYTVTVDPTGNGSVVVTVTNHADGPDIPDRDDWGPHQPLAARGRGLGIVEHLAAGVEVAAAPSAVTVTVLVSPA